jgi:hypothetical protein
MRSGRKTQPQLRSTPFLDRYNVAGLVVGDICFECECRIIELGGDDAMVLAWCECGWPEDAAMMEVLSVTSLSR